MHKFFFILFLVFDLNCFFVISTNAQDTLPHKYSLNSDTAQTDLPITILYDIEIKSNKNKPGIEETYNGGNKTVFVSGENSRIRLVSLMRIQSIFFKGTNDIDKKIVVVKESGKQKFKYDLTGQEWLSINKKYDSLSCVFIDDSLEILNYNCKKALIQLEDGKEITVYYSTLLKPLSYLIEPAFKCIPGLVLKYSYETGKGSITYTARKINKNFIQPSIFKVPAKGYIIKNICKSCPSLKATYNNDDDSID